MYNPNSRPAPFSEFASLSDARTETGGKLSSENFLFSTKTFWFLDATKKAFLWKNNLVLMACVCNCNVISSNLIILLYSLLLFLCSFSFNLAAGYDLGWCGRDDNYNNKMKYSDISWILLQTSSPQPPSAVKQSAPELQTKVIPRYATILQSRRTPVPYILCVGVPILCLLTVG